MFWMDEDAFLGIFNTLHAVDLAGSWSARPLSQERTKVNPGASAASLPPPSAGSAKKDVAGMSSREGRIEGSWEGEECGGRFTEGTGWLQGTQAFLHIGPRDRTRGSTGGSTAVPEAAVVPSSGVTKGNAADSEDTAQVLITVTQEDSRYHRRDFRERRERQRSIGFLVHSHRWSSDSKRYIPKLSKILQFTLQPSVPGAATPGANAGGCEIKVTETGLAVEEAYNEAEEDAEGNGMTANAESLGGLLASAQALAAEKAAIEHSRGLLRLQ